VRLKLKILRLSVAMVVALTLAATPLVGVGTATADSQWPEIVSVSNSGQQADDQSPVPSNSVPQISDDGRYVAFESIANNLGTQRPGTNGLYIRDRQAGTTTLVSVNLSGQEQNGNLFNVFSFSRDGHHIAFIVGGATNMDPSATDPTISYVYVKDLDSGLAALASIGVNGEQISSQQLSLSGDGSVIAFRDVRNTLGGIYARNLTTSVTTKITGSGVEPKITSDGRYVAYALADGMYDFGVYDLATGQKQLTQVFPVGHGGHMFGISDDSQYLLFTASAADLPSSFAVGCVQKTLSQCIRLVRFNREAGDFDEADTTNPGLTPVAGDIGSGVLAEDGQRALFTSYFKGFTSDEVDTSYDEVYLHDFSTGLTTLVSRNKWGAPMFGPLQTPIGATGDASLLAISTDAANYGIEAPFTDQTFIEPTAGFANEVDNQSPVLGAPTWTQNPVQDTQATTLSVPVTDDSSGVVYGEYFVGGDPGRGQATSMQFGGADLTTEVNGLADGTYQVGMRAVDNAGNWSQIAYTTLNVLSASQLTTLDPAKIWVGLKNSDDVGVKFDLKAEVYVNGVLVTSGETDSVAAGSSGFNNAKLDTISFGSFSPVDFPAGSQVSIKLYVRNACTGSGHNSGSARLWYNDVAAGSRFGAAIGGADNPYYLLSGSVLGTSAGSGPKATVDVQSGAKCSAFKPFGTWSVTP
jgi:hypothetical protein